MAFAESGILAAVMAAMGIAPGRKLMPVHMVMTAPPVALAVVETDTSEALGDAALDVSALPDVADPLPEPVIDPPAKKASTRAFVKWLRMADLSPTERKRVTAQGGFTQRDMIGLYSEFCELAHVEPLSDRQLMNKVKSCGIETYRPPAKVVNGKMHRPTIYKLKPERQRRAMA